MKKILMIICVAFLASCTNRANLNDDAKDFKIIAIEGCEYLIYDRFTGSTSYGFMAHKGNCKNPIHKQ